MGDNMGKYQFYKAATLACDGAITLTRRYAEVAREKAKTAPTPERKAELENMAEHLDWIATEPPRTFWEACQHVMLYHIFLIVDNGPGVTSMGRFDQYVWPYLKKELEEGTITMDYAQELVDALRRAEARRRSPVQVRQVRLGARGSEASPEVLPQLRRSL